MEFSLIIDALIAVLLVATNAYATVLNRKLTVLRDGKSDMAALIASFSESAERAGNGIETLKQAAGRSGEDLLEVICRSWPGTITILITGEPSVESASRLIRAGRLVGCCASAVFRR